MVRLASLLVFCIIGCTKQRVVEEREPLGHRREHSRRSRIATDAAGADYNVTPEWV